MKWQQYKGESLSVGTAGGDNFGGTGVDGCQLFQPQAVQITELWPTKTGQQIAEGNNDYNMASVVTRIPVGWTMSRELILRPNLI